MSATLEFKRLLFLLYILYVVTIEAPVVLTALGGILGVNKWFESRERISIMKLEIQRNEAIAMGIMPEQVALKMEKH